MNAAREAGTLGPPHPQLQQEQQPVDDEQQQQQQQQQQDNEIRQLAVLGDEDGSRIREAIVTLSETIAEQKDRTVRLDEEARRLDGVLAAYATNTPVVVVRRPPQPPPLPSSSALPSLEARSTGARANAGVAAVAGDVAHGSPAAGTVGAAGVLGRDGGGSGHLRLQKYGRVDLKTAWNDASAGPDACADLVARLQQHLAELNMERLEDFARAAVHG